MLSKKPIIATVRTIVRITIVPPRFELHQALPFAEQKNCNCQAHRYHQKPDDDWSQPIRHNGRSSLGWSSVDTEMSVCLAGYQRGSSFFDVEGREEEVGPMSNFGPARRVRRRQKGRAAHSHRQPGTGRQTGEQKCTEQVVDDREAEHCILRRLHVTKDGRQTVTGGKAVWKGPPERSS